MDEPMSHARPHPATAHRGLSERIAERVQQKPSASIASRNRGLFISQRNEIQQAYNDGCSLLAIWRVLHDEQRIPFSYQAFRRYSRKLLKTPESNTPSQPDET